MFHCNFPSTSLVCAKTVTDGRPTINENYVYIIVFIVGVYNLFMSLFPESDPYESGTESLCYDSGIKG